MQQGMKKCCKRTVEHLKEKAAERLINEWENDEEVKTIEELEEENKRLRELLKAIEYVNLKDFFVCPELISEDVMEQPVCPECSWKKGDGHHADCKLGQALEGGGSK